MNENVNISFIPKKPLARGELIKHHRPVVGISFFISFTIAIVTVGASVAQFVRIENLEQTRIVRIGKLEKYNSELNEDDTIKKIEKFRELERKIAIVKDLLSRHVAPSELFDFFERTTPRQVSFESFSFNGSGDVVQVNASGKAVSYEVLAALSLLYKKEKNVLIDYSLSGFSLDETGRRSFNFIGIFTPSLISYSQAHASSTDEETNN